MTMNLINYFIGTFFISVSTYYVAVKIVDTKFEILKINIIKWLFIETFFLLFLYSAEINDIFRILVNMLMLVYFYYKLFNLSIFQCLLLSFMSFSFILISEIIFIIFNVFLFNITTNFMKSHYSVTLTSNFIISLMTMLLSNVDLIIRKYKNLFKEIKPTYKLDVSIIIVGSILCLVIILYYIFFDINPLANIIIALFLILCYLSFPIILLGEKNANYKLRIQYETILKDIENYEEDLKQQRMKNHENINMLISIKGMINKSNKQLYNFINQIISDHISDDKDILYMTKDIPIGGLQGLIYQKLLVMKNKKINFLLNIDKNITKYSFNSLSLNTIKDICMIVGVFIDNAIQEVEEKEEKNIFVNIYDKNDKIIIQISNNYQGFLNINLFDNKGFSTKGKNHGYGLSLVKEIINNNNNLENIREITSNIFIQKLIIKK